HQPGQHRRGVVATQQGDGEALGREHLGGGSREGLGTVAGVVGDRYRDISCGTVWMLGNQPVGHPGGCPADGRDVHPIRAYAHWGAQSRGAETQTRLGTVVLLGRAHDWITLASREPISWAAA